MALDATPNDAFTTLAASIGTADTAIQLTDDTNFSVPPKEYNATIWSKSFRTAAEDVNRERVRVTAKPGDLTVTRAQEGTSASAHAAGDFISVGATKAQWDIVDAKLDALDLRTLGDAAFRVRLAANQTGVPTATITKVLFDTRDYDLNNDFDITTNNELVVPRAGHYLCIASTIPATAVANMQWLTQINKNGSAVSRSVSFHTTTSTETSKTQDILSLAQGDTLDVRVRHNDASAKDISSTSTDTYFCLREFKHP